MSILNHWLRQVGYSPETKSMFTNPMSEALYKDAKMFQTLIVRFITGSDNFIRSSQTRRLLSSAFAILVRYVSNYKLP